MNTKAKRAVSVILIVVGVLLVVLMSSVSVNRTLDIKDRYANQIESLTVIYERDYETYYHYKNGKDFYEIKTRNEIDVDNVSINAISFFGDNVKIQLDYEGFANNVYVFSYFGSDTFVSLEVKDLNGNVLELTKYQETQELERNAQINQEKQRLLALRAEELDKTNILIVLIIVGAILTVLGIAIFALSTPMKLASVKETKCEPNNRCTYCGYKYKETDSKCSNCGAPLEK